MHVAVCSDVEDSVEAAEESSEWSRIGLGGFNSNAQSAGVNDSALKAESNTEIAIVKANCLYMLPTRPPSSATGTNTAERINAMPITGADTSLHGFDSCFSGRQAMLEVMYDCFNHHDRVVNHDADRQDESKHRQRIHREAEQRKENKRADERDRNRDQGNDRGPDVLQEDEDHDRDEDQRLDERFQYFVNGGFDGRRGVVDDLVIHVWRKDRLRMLHRLVDRFRRFELVRAGQQVNGHRAAGLLLRRPKEL